MRPTIEAHPVFSAGFLILGAQDTSILKSDLEKNKTATYEPGEKSHGLGIYTARIMQKLRGACFPTILG